MSEREIGTKALSNDTWKESEKMKNERTCVCR